MLERPHQHHVVRQARQVGAAGVLEPCTTAICGNACGRHARLVGEAAPAVDEDFGLVHQVGTAAFHQADDGQLVLQRNLLARRPFFSPMGATVPPLTALSFTEMRQRLPATTPMPTMEPPPMTDFLPSSSCMFRPARRLISMNGVPRSSRRATRSRGSSCLRFSNFALDSIRR